MAGGDKPKALFTASEVARFCQVDLKTIHNWADRGEVRHFRTPGRHLRFRRAEVLDFLRRYGYPIPEVLTQGRPRVLVLDAESSTTASVKRALSKRFDVRTTQNPIDALITLGADTPDVLILGKLSGPTDAIDIVGRLGDNEATRHVRTVVYAPDGPGRKKLLDTGASAFVVRPDAAKLRETLEALLGLER